MKHEIRKLMMSETKNAKQYDLEDRTLRFAKAVKDFVKIVQKNTANIEYTKQVIRSSGSIGANYIEANEALSKKDFLMRIKICRKESKETIFWLNLLEAEPKLISESTELMKIFSAIMRKSG